jgi:hypothetical protein
MAHSSWDTLYIFKECLILYPASRKFCEKYLTVLRRSEMFCVLKFELILKIGSNNVLAEGARKIFTGAALDRAALYNDSRYVMVAYFQDPRFVTRRVLYEYSQFRKMNAITVCYRKPRSITATTGSKARNCLRPLEHLDLGFESRSRHGCLRLFRVCV